MAARASARPKPRLHRLPVHTDYVLIPAPQDLSLPDIAQKSPVPPIIVTPCEPSSTRDFSLAFLPLPPKPSFRERLQNTFSPTQEKTFPINFDTASPVTSNFTFRVRSILALLLVAFLVVCHLITHRLAVRMNKPHIEFAVQNSNSVGSHMHAVGVDAYGPGSVEGLGAKPVLPVNPISMNWLKFHSRIVGNPGVALQEADLDVARDQDTASP